MKFRKNGISPAGAADRGRDIGRGIAALLLLASVGCATSPMPVTIRHDGTTADAAPVAVQQKQGGADQSVAELVALLESKEMISPEEAARLRGQPVNITAGQKGPSAPAGAEWTERVRFGGDIRLRAETDRTNEDASTPVRSSEAGGAERGTTAPRMDEKALVRLGRKDSTGQSLAELVALLKNKNVISAEEAGRVTRQSATAAGENGAVTHAEAADREQADKITAMVTQELMKNLQEQVKKQVQEELAKEMKEREKEQIETITASVTEEVKKNLPEQVKSEVRQQQPGETAEKEEIENVNQRVSNVKRQLAELIGTLPEWTKRIRLSGDVRLRYEADLFDDNNAILAQPSDPTRLMNTRNDDYNFKYRVRLGLEAQINDQLDAVARLSTGNTTNPVSTNTILGDFMNKDNIVFDLAYLKWKPIDGVALYGGRMPNPWFSSALVWDRDLNFEGIALEIKRPVTEDWTAFLTGGVFPLQDDALASESKWLYAGQIGVERKDVAGISAKAGAAYYYFDNITGVRNPDPLNPGATDWSAPLYQQKGNTIFFIDPTNSDKTGFASEFKELNLTATLDIGFWDPVHIVLTGDYVKNLGFDKSDVSARTGVPDPEEDTYGYQLGLSVGYPTTYNFGLWKASLHYRYVGADAVVDSFTDSDFHLGGTNAKGWILETEFGLLKNTWLAFRWITADEVSGPPLSIDVFQVDLNARF
jgi:hypothetical protein